MVGDTLEDFRGIVYVLTVIDRLSALREHEITFEDVAAPPMTIPEDTTISDTVDAFQEEHQELVLVTGEREDEIAGRVTATDALEAVMGEIDDPLDMQLQSRSRNAYHDI